MAEDHPPYHLAQMQNADIDAWNVWRQEYPDLPLDFSNDELENAHLWRINLNHATFTEANLSFAILSSADMSYVNLDRANLNRASLVQTDLRYATLRNARIDNANLLQCNLQNAVLPNVILRDSNLYRANLAEACLTGAYMSGANLQFANLSGVDLRGADLQFVDMSGANLSGADLRGADLRSSILNGVILDRANLTGCIIHGMGISSTRSMNDACALDLVVTNYEPGWREPRITVDDLGMAQLLSVLLYNPHICQMIDLVGRQIVLIMGTFPHEREAVLEVIKEEVRGCGYLPLVVYLEESLRDQASDMINLLRPLPRYILLDLTRINILALETFIADATRFVPIQSFLIEGSQTAEISFIEGCLYRYHWCLPLQRFEHPQALRASFQQRIIEPVEQSSLI